MREMTMNAQVKSSSENAEDIVGMFDYLDGFGFKSKEQIVCNQLRAVIRQLRDNGVINPVTAGQVMLALTPYHDGF